MATPHSTVTQQTDYRRRYHQLYDEAPVGYCTLDAAGTILAVNATAAQWFGVEKSALVQTTFQSRLMKGDQDRFLHYLQDALTQPHQRLDQLCVQGAGDSTMYVRLENTAAESSTRCHLTMIDVTELHEAHNRLLQRSGELVLFNRVAQVLSSGHDLDQILMLVMEEVRRLLEVAACSIWLVDSITGELVCRQAIGPHRDAILGWRLSIGQGIAGWVANSGQSLLVNNTRADERHFDAIDRLTGEPLHSILCVPMFAHQEVIGVVQVLDTEPNRFAETEQTSQELLATITSLAIDNARLREQVGHDTKTKRLLLSDLNRRIAVMQAGTIRLLSTIRRYASLKKEADKQAIMTDLLARMQGRKRVYAFLAEFEWNPLPLSELIHRVIQGTLDALNPDARISVDISSSPVRVTPEQADSLSTIINELVINTVRHAIGSRRVAGITVDVGRIGDSLYVHYRDDGPGWPDDVMRFENHHSGVYMLQKIVRKELDGKLDLYNDDGAVTEIRCKNFVQNVV